MSNSEFYYELDEDIKNYFIEVEKDFGFAVNLKYIFQANSKQKQMIKLIKLKCRYLGQINLQSKFRISLNYQTCIKN